MEKDIVERLREYDPAEKGNAETILQLMAVAADVIEILRGSRSAKPRQKADPCPYCDAATWWELPALRLDHRLPVANKE